MMAYNLIKAVFCLATIGVAIFVGTIFYKGTKFFHRELMHAQLMAIGDVREPTLIERLKTGLVWTPFIIYAIAAILLIFIMARHLRNAEN